MTLYTTLMMIPYRTEVKVVYEEDDKFIWQGEAGDFPIKHYPVLNREVVRLDADTHRHVIGTSTYETGVITIAVGADEVN